jgi:hypothetical protein
LNILDGVTATAAELNILDGVTATAAELNILDGATLTTAELNILDGVTATAAQINKSSTIADNAPGSAPIYACRAWVYFNGTGTPAIAASGNVAGITKAGTGNFTVNLTTAMPDANYVTVSSDDLWGLGYQDTRTTTSFRHVTYDNSFSLADTGQVVIAIFR